MKKYLPELSWIDPTKCWKDLISWIQEEVQSLTFLCVVCAFIKDSHQLSHPQAPCHRASLHYMPF